MCLYPFGLYTDLGPDMLLDLQLIDINLQSTYHVSNPILGAYMEGIFMDLPKNM